MTKFFTLFLFIFALAPAFAEEGERQKTDSEIWNEGVDFYRQGDTTNALATLRSIMLSRTHGARAAEVVAKLEYDAARKPGSQDALTRLEEAATAAQIALRANPEDARIKRNFSLALADLPELRERKRIESILEASKNTPPQQMLKAAVGESRRLMAEVPSIAVLATNDADNAVAKADDCSIRAAKLADTWLSLKEAVCQAVTNEKEMAEISLHVDELRGKTEEAARLISDIDGNAVYGLAAAEDGFTKFYKSFILPPEAIGETILTQSNACRNVDVECGRSWQRESLDYTRAFRAKFPAWAKAYEQAAAADTNKPPFTAENQAKISDLATRLEKLQLECVENSNAESQSKALDTAVEISKLLPKDNNSNKSQNPNQNQNQNRNNDKNKSDENKDNPPQNQQDDASDDKNDESDKDDERKDDKKSEPKENPANSEIESILKRAQERSDEHEAEKKARMRRVRLPPNERDW